MIFHYKVNDYLATMAEVEREFDDFKKMVDKFKKEVELKKEELSKTKGELAMIKEDAVDFYIRAASMYTTEKDIAAFIKNSLDEKYKNK